MVVKVYSMSSCAYCHVLMDWLDTLGVKYQEIDAEDLDFKAVPVTEIDDIRIVGLDRPAILKALRKKEIIK